MSKQFRGIRGAVTVERDDEQLILNETERLLREMIECNHIFAADVASAIVTATPDIRSTFPAKAIRELEGWTYVPVMCAQELAVEDALPLCVRVMIHANTTLGQDEICHVYLNDAIRLRPDLVQ